MWTDGEPWLFRASIVQIVECRDKVVSDSLACAWHAKIASNACELMIPNLKLSERSADASDPPAWVTVLTGYELPEKTGTGQCTELLIVGAGSGTLETESTSLAVGEGDVLVLPAGCTSSIGSKSEIMALRLVFDTAALMIPRSELLQVTGAAPLFVYEPRAHPHVGIRVQLRLPPSVLARCVEDLLRMRSELAVNLPGSELLCRSILTSNVLELARHYARSNDPVAVAFLRIALLLSWLEEHFEEPLTLESLVDRFDLSQSTLQRCFQKTFGTSPLNYMWELRMKRAQALLRNTEAKVREIAPAVGILDANYFARRFRQHTGLEPTEYRNRHRLHGGPDALASNG